jgi:hypothetical protein
MTRNPSHQKKSRGQLHEYSRGIKEQRYQPTVDDMLIFNDTTNPGEDLSAPPIQKRRPINRTAKLLDHFKRHLIPYAVTVFLAVATYFMVDSRIVVATLTERSSNHTTQIDRLDNEVKELGKKDGNQDLEIREHRVRIEQLERNPNSSSRKSPRP